MTIICCNNHRAVVSSVVINYHVHVFPGKQICHTAIRSWGFGARCRKYLRTWAALCRYSWTSCYQAKGQVYYFQNTEKEAFDFEGLYHTVTDVKNFGVKTVKGGFRRRPELIKQKGLCPAAQSLHDGMKSYGLFDKCEQIQQELTETVLRLLNIDGRERTGCLMLDIGCGHGWSLTIPSFNGFCVVGVDLDLQALSVVQHKISSKYLPSQNTHVVRMDAANGLCFSESVFDVAISISFLQWLCVGKHSKQTLSAFFDSLNFVLKPGGKAGLQFYPRNVGDVQKVISCAEEYFKGALISDFPHINRGRKLFLILTSNKV